MLQVLVYIQFCPIGFLVFVSYVYLSFSFPTRSLIEKNKSFQQRIPGEKISHNVRGAALYQRILSIPNRSDNTNSIKLFFLLTSLCLRTKNLLTSLLNSITPVLSIYNFSLRHVNTISLSILHANTILIKYQPLLLN